MLDLADAPVILDQPPYRLHDAHLVPGVAEHEVPPSLAGQGGQLPGVGGRDRERLLAQDVGARLEGGPDLLGAEGDRPGDHDEVGPSLDDVAPVRGRAGEAELRADLLEQRRVAPIDDHRLHVLATGQGRQVRGDGPGAGADDAESQPVGRAHPQIR